MASANNYIALAMGLDVTDLKSGVTEAKRQLTEFETEFKKTTASMQDWRKTEEGLTARLDTLGKKLQTQKSIIAGYRAEIENVEKKEGDHSAELQALKKQLDNAEIAYGKTRRSINYYEKQLKTVREESQQLAQTQQEINITTEVLNKGFTVMKGVLSNLVTQGINSLVRSLKEVLDYGMEFESSFTDVRKTVDATEEEFAELEAGIRRMALSLPQSASQIAEVASLAGQMGIATDAILDFTEVMIMLGDATNLSSDEASSVLAQFANVTRMNNDEFQNLGSAIVELGNNFATTESVMINMAQRISAVGVQVGLTQQDILGLSTALSALGIRAEAGATSISNFLSDMQVAVYNETDMLEQYAKVAGKTADEFAEAFKRSAIDGLQLFVDGLAEIEASGGSAVVVLEEMGITAARERQAVLSLTNGNDVLRSAIETANNAWRENTALVREATLRYGTTASQLQLMKNAWAELGLEIYENVQPALNTFFGLLTDIAEAFTGNVNAGDELETAITNLVSAFGDYKTAQEEAERVTNATTEAMRAQAEQALVSAITTAGRTYSASQREIGSLRNDLSRDQSRLSYFEDQIDAIIRDASRELGQELNKRDVIRSIQVLNSKPSREDRQQAQSQLNQMGLNVYQIQNLSDYTLQIDKLRESIDETTISINEQSQQMVEAMVLAYNAVQDGIITYEELDKISVNFSDGVRELGEAYSEGEESMQLFLENMEINETVLERVLRQQRAQQAQTEYGSVSWARYAGAINAVTEAYNAMQKAQSDATGVTITDDGGGGGGDEEDPVDKIMDSLKASVDVAQRMASLIGTEERRLVQQLLSLYESALKKLLALGEEVNQDLIDDLVEKINELNKQLESLGGKNNDSGRNSWLSGIIGLGGFNDEVQKAIQEFKEAWDEVANYVTTLLNGIGEVVSNLYQIQINQIDAMIDELEEKYEELMEQVTKSSNEKIAILNAQLENGYITEQEYYNAVSQAQQEALQKQADAEEDYNTQLESLEEQRDELARKQFEANKANAIANVWINLAGAIMQTYMQSGWVLGSIFAALLTAQAATQTALISSQQYTGLATGGVVDSPTMALIGEAGAEAVMPLENNTGWIRNLAGQLNEAMGDSDLMTGRGDVTTNNTKTQTFNQVIQSPKSLTRKEIYRQTKELLRLAGRR